MTESQIDRIVVLRRRLIVGGLLLVGQALALPRGWGCGGIFWFHDFLTRHLRSVFPEMEDRSGDLDASLAVHSHARPVRRVLRVSALAERCGGIACKSGASCCHMGSDSNIR